MSTLSTEVEFDPIAALEWGIEALKAKAEDIAVERRYYDGEHPRLEWITKIRKVFGDQVADQVHQCNYCEGAIEKPLSRMKVLGFDDPTADELFRLNRLHLAQDDEYRDAMIAGSDYVIVAEAEPGSEVPYDIVVQRPEDCHVEYASLKPGDRDYAVKVWADPFLGDEGGFRAMVWDSTDYWRYIAPIGDPEGKPLPKADEFDPDPEDDSGPHGFDKVPVIEFKRGREGRPRLKSLRPIQDRIDMLEIEKIIAGLFGASRQRVFFTHQELDDGDTESSPDFAIVLDPGNNEDGKSSVSEFEHTPLENFDDGIDSEIDRFYEIASLPKHGRVNPGAGASGEALKADEGDFVATIKGYTDAFGEAWVEVFSLLGIETKPIWLDPETRNENDQAQTVKTLSDAGAPLEWLMAKYMDLTEDELVEFRKALADQRAQEAEAREAAVQALDQGRDTTDVVESRFQG